MPEDRKRANSSPIKPIQQTPTKAQAATSKFPKMAAVEVEVERQTDDFARLAKLIEDGQKEARDQMTNLKTELVTVLTNLVDEKLNGIERRVNAVEVAIDNMKAEPFDPDVTLVVYRLEEAGDDRRSVEEMFGVMGVNDDVSIIGIKRIQQRENQEGNQGVKPPLLKVELETGEQKIRALKAKQKLKDTKFDDVYIRSSQTHVERMTQQNLKTLISRIPGLDNRDFFFAGNGRLTAKGEDTGRGGGRGRGRGGGRGRGRGGQGRGGEPMQQ
jgi:hypothetical protein